MTLAVCARRRHSFLTPVYWSLSSMWLTICIPYWERCSGRPDDGPCGHFVTPLWLEGVYKLKSFLNVTPIRFEEKQQDQNWEAKGFNGIVRKSFEGKRKRANKLGIPHLLRVVSATEDRVTFPYFCLLSTGYLLSSAHDLWTTAKVRSEAAQVFVGED